MIDAWSAAKYGEPNELVAPSNRSFTDKGVIYVRLSARLFQASSAIVALVIGLIFFAVPMSASATGQYDYICIAQDGSSWAMQQGEKTTDCKGAFLQKYIDGKKVATYRLTTTGALATKKPDPRACVLAVIGTVYTIYTTVKGGGIGYYSRAALGNSWLSCIVGN